MSNWTRRPVDRLRRHYHAKPIDDLYFRSRFWRITIGVVLFWAPVFLFALFAYQDRGAILIVAGLLLVAAIQGAAAYLATQSLAELRTRQALVREANQRWEQIATTAPVKIWMSDSYRQGIYFNRRWLNFTGRTLEGSIGEQWLADIHPDDLINFLATRREAIDQRQPFVIEFRLRRFDGVYHWMIGHGEPRFVGGEFNGYTGAAHDIQDRKEAEDIVADAYDRTLEALVYALDLRDKETEGHSLRVTERMVELAAALGMANGEMINARRGALLHDIGKLGIPDAILHKPGPLDDAEWAVMRMHPIYAYEMLKPITYLAGALTIPIAHHEKWDGSGYPRGLAGEEIPLPARAFSVVDAWDAMQSDRPYRKAMAGDAIVAELRRSAGRAFDPSIVNLFIVLFMEPTDNA